ncbi:ABC transporter substrate-binding protein [Phaeobacter sp. J2-8]|uniref:ABC transporter substrate-binding protein n=1 Tax=Phaeobacter sp. J2-8 TaxID=2931394 RepID=UPI001FD05C6E|nr:ABC transporter substrate-binding protein [Phaeobacter sp. J2-8]MCJ7873664.1 ABC transporter substrate-binding protein [Phaeobacter sp. J2-8]
MRLAAACLLTLVFAVPAAAEKHALVVSNAEYLALADLRNTHSDADAYAALFREFGYQISRLKDSDLDGMLNSFDTFLAGLEPGDDVIVVFSGHGWSDGQVNYLVPTDAPSQGSDRKLKRETVALKNGVNGILDEIEMRNTGLTVAIIDACRNNPFKPPEGRRSACMTRGLAPLSPRTGSFIVYSAGEGQEALDRLPDDPPEQKLSVFTRSFLPYLEQRLHLEEAVSRAQVDTARLARGAGGHLQEPAYYDAALGFTCIAGQCGVSGANSSADRAAEADKLLILGFGLPDDLQILALERIVAGFPDTPAAGIAKKRLVALTRPEPEPEPDPPTPAPKPDPEKVRPSPPATAQRRGADGAATLTYWQAPSILNPYLSGSTKDIEAASLVLEPLASFDPEGNILPVLANRVPTLENGGVSEDLRTITWRLRDGVTWSDGTALTADDVAFTAAYCMDARTGCAQSNQFSGIESVELIDRMSVRFRFLQPTAYPYRAFVGTNSPVLQKSQFAPCKGAKAPSCTQNFRPRGTGPFVVRDYSSRRIEFEANRNYREARKPAFETISLVGGGDAQSAATAVFETGKSDFAWNLQLAPDVLDQMAEGGRGVPVVAFRALVERLMLNLTDPSPKLAPDIRSTRDAPHPALTQRDVRRALSMAIDRELLTEIGYGVSGRSTCDLIPAPKVYASGTTDCLVQDIDGANRLLDAAGWIRGSDGVRTRNGVRLSILFQTSTNAVRQDFQALIREWWRQIGVETELRNIAPTVFFGGGSNSEDTYLRFYADVQMYSNVFAGADPEDYLNNFRCGSEPRPDNGWFGDNITRYCDPEFDKLLKELGRTGGLSERQEIIKRLDNMVSAGGHVSIPLVQRAEVAARSVTLGGVVANSYAGMLWNIADWHRLD